jgi:hypothetical protein
VTDAPPPLRKRLLLAELEDRLALGLLKKCYEANRTHDAFVARTPEVTRNLLQTYRFDAVVVRAHCQNPEGLMRVREGSAENAQTRTIAVIGDEPATEAEHLYALGADLIVRASHAPQRIGEFALKACNQPTVLSGSLNQMTVPDLLQVLCLSHRTLTLRINAEGKHAVLWIVKGEIHHAVCGASRGQEAINEVLLAPQGRFWGTLFALPPARTIQRDWQPVMLSDPCGDDESQRDDRV